MKDEDIQKHIEENCRNAHGEPMMDEQSFYEGAKWYRDTVTENNYSINNKVIDHLKKIVRIYEMGKVGTSAIFAQGQAMDGYTQLYNYNDLAEKAKEIIHSIKRV